MSEVIGDDLPEAVRRLARGAGGTVFLSDRQVEAARRLARLFQRARIEPRVVMRYDPATTVGGRGAMMGSELTDSAAAARQRLTALGQRLPADCWSVLFDVCGLERGVQEVEVARGWPRRGGKLVLRIALDHLANEFGLDDLAEGEAMSRQRGWLPQRPAMFSD